MAVHTGECTRRDADYFGPTVNRVARLLAIGHGGQVLVSNAARSALGDDGSADLWLRDLGEHGLKDMGRPEHVFQVCSAGLEDVTRPLRSIDRPRHNLPAARTSFTGREGQSVELRELLGRERLVTVTGAGGCGKTRLATRVAEEMVNHKPDGVWLVELASVRDPGLVSAAVATAVDVRAEGAPDTLAAVIDALRDRELLLVVDNCEHLIEASAAAVHALLRSCPHVSVLATSREPLAVEGEAVYWLPSLTVPDADTRDPERVGASEASRMLADRIRLQQPAFVVDSDNAAAVADICRRLDGIPLALELVAARVGPLTLDEVRERLDERFDLLTRGARSALPRHRTLRALIDWSYDLLSIEEQLTLSRCAVFAGSFDLGAAEAVCGRAPVARPAVFDHVAALAAKNLLQQDGSAARSRFRLLETVREYAWMRLVEDERELESCHLAHRDHYVDVAERAESQLYGKGQAEALNRLSADLDDFRAALDWSSEDPGRVEGGLRLAGALAQVWFTRGLYREGLARTADLLTATEGPSPGRAKALWAAGLMATVLGEDEAAAAYLVETLELARQSSDRSLVARSLDLLGLRAFFRNDLALARRLLRGEHRRGSRDRGPVVPCRRPRHPQLDHAARGGGRAGRCDGR